MARPLPKLPGFLANSTCIREAYDVLVRLEKGLTEINDQQSLIRCRVLGYLILKIPSNIGRVVVATEILSAPSDSTVFQLGEFYIDHFIRPFKKAQGRLPQPSLHVSRPSFDTQEELATALLQEAPQDHRTAKKNALVRDGFRCVVSGRFDYASARLSPHIVDGFKDFTMASTQCAHILSDSTNYSITESNKKAEYAGNVLAVLQRFGYTSLPNDLNGSRVHRLENVITLDPNVHSLFGILELWLEETDTPHTYKIQTVSPRLVSYPPVTLTTPDLERLPLPSPQYIALHAACCQVAHLSGAGEAIDHIMRDLEETRVLAEDGGSAFLLDHQLQVLARKQVSVSFQK